MGEDPWIVGETGDPNLLLLLLLVDLNPRYQTTDLTTLHSLRRHSCLNAQCPSPDKDLDRSHGGPYHVVNVPLPKDASAHAIGDLLHNEWDCDHADDRGQAKATGPLCRRCGTNTSVSLARPAILPSLLILNIERPDVPIRCDLEVVLADERYDVHSIIHNTTTSLGSHYTVYRVDDAGSWHLLDDSNTKTSQPNLSSPLTTQVVHTQRTKPTSTPPTTPGHRRDPASTSLPRDSAPLGTRPHPQQGGPAQGPSLKSACPGPEMMDLDALPDNPTIDAPTSLGPYIPYPDGRHVWLALTVNSA